jgi:hypothetical protein
MVSYLEFDSLWWDLILGDGGVVDSRPWNCFLDAALLA